MYGAETLPAITTGTDLVTASSKMMTVKDAEMDEGKPKGVLAGSLGGLAKQMTLLIQTNLLQNEILFSIKDAILGLGPTDQEKKEGSIGAGDTDKPPKEKGPGILSKVGSTLGKLNPFGGGGFMDTLLKLGLAVGGLALLNIFGDKLTGPLAGLIKAFKEGKIGEKIGEIVTDIQEYLTPLWDKIKIKVGEFIAGVQTVFGIIQGAYKVVNDYVMSFDTKGKVVKAGPLKGLVMGDDKLDSDEFDALKEDLKQKTVEYISSFFKDVLLSLAGGLLGLTLINQTVKLAAAKLTPLFTGTSTTALTAGGRLAMGVPIAGLLIYGVTTTWSNISSSLAKTLEENDGKMDYSDFFANFLGGDGEGGVMNALRQGFKVGGTFALAGMAIGAIAGAGILSIPGALMGGLIGTGIGFLVGAFTGWLGSDKLKKIGDAFTTMIDDTVDTIKNFFGDIIDSVKSFFTGSTTSYETDPKRINEDLKEQRKYLNEMEAQKLKNPKDFDNPFMMKRYNDQLAEVERLEKLLANVPEARKKKEQEDITSGTHAIDSNLKNLRATRDRDVESLKKAIKDDNVKGQNFYREQIKGRNKQILDVEAKKQNLLKRDYDVDYKIPKIKMDPVVNKFDDSMQKSPNHPSNATIISNNNNDSSMKKQETQNLFGPGMSQDNPQFAAILAYNQSKLT